MRQFWLSLLLSLSLALGGVAHARAANECPELKMPSSDAHGCCPDDVMPEQGEADRDSPDSEKSPDCKLGQACRTAAAVAPAIVPVAAPTMVPAPVRLLGGATDILAGPVTPLWRPPQA